MKERYSPEMNRQKNTESKWKVSWTKRQLRVHNTLYVLWNVENEKVKLNDYSPHFPPFGLRQFAESGAMFKTNLKGIEWEEGWYGD